MNDPAGILVGFICVAFAVVLACTIGSIILRAAIAWYNKMVGGAKSEHSVPEPGKGKALGIVFLTLLANLAGSFFIGMVFGAGAAVVSKTGNPSILQAAQILGQLVALPISFVIMSALLTGMLPTTFPRAVLVTLLYMLICILIAVFFAVLFMIIFGGSLLLRR